MRSRPGDKLEYQLEGDRATIRVHPGLRALKSVLASNKGKGCVSLRSARLLSKRRVVRVYVE